MKAVTDGATSAMDLVRAFESFLLKYPSSTQRAEVEYAVAKAAAELKDDGRTIRYGERVLAIVPDDILMLERVSGALVRTNSAARALLGNVSAERDLSPSMHWPTRCMATTVRPPAPAARRCSWP